jgi:putative phosphoserine phosphatase/1-acylglycerol-3-phosphate O-acyltransferase
MTGLAKARAVWRYAEDHGVDLSRSYAYGDQNADLPMLDTVGHPVAVNPSARLARIARENGWETVRWRETTAGAGGAASRRQAAQGAAR